MVKVGRTGFTPKQLTANVTKVLEQLPKYLPGGAAAVKAVHLKTHDSVALPIFASLPCAAANSDGAEEAVPTKTTGKRRKGTLHVIVSNVAVLVLSHLCCGCVVAWVLCCFPSYVVALALLLSCANFVDESVSASSNKKVSTSSTRKPGSQREEDVTAKKSKRARS
jgi:Ribosomal protein L1p/L10e family